MKLKFENKVLDLLSGSIDIHIHSAPDVYPRILCPVSIARHANEMQMKAVVIKNHFVSTAGMAQIASQEAVFPVFGGLALNMTVGGLNVHAVNVALKMGAKIVWLPTLHAQKYLQNKRHLKNLTNELMDDIQGIYLLKEDGGLKDELYPIFDLLAKRGAVLATGHVTIKEAKKAVREAAKAGVKKIVITHPLNSFFSYTVEDMKEMLDLGATYLEHVYNDTTRQVSHPIPIEEVVSAIKAIGPDHCIMSTDSGQWLNPVPAQQMAIYIKDMLTRGLKDLEIRKMVADNPSSLLGI
jgi:hypothetical protein